MMPPALMSMDADQIDAAILPSSEIPAGKYFVLRVPADAPAVNKYVGAFVKASRNAAVAHDFLAFACGPQSQTSWKLSHFDTK